MASSAPDAILILVHGGALSGRMYKDMAPLLSARGYEVICPDLPGHGERAAQTGPFTFLKSTALLKTIAEEIKHKSASEKTERPVVLVGVSLGGQAVLHFLTTYPNLVDAAVVSGVSLHPPSDDASWEMPHMPSPDDMGWMEIIMGDVERMGMEAASAVQAESFGFSLQLDESRGKIPPVLVVVGEHDVAMARRDFAELFRALVARNASCEKVILENAWHNHPIDVPGMFSDIAHNWLTKFM
ncbi:Alpha/Beta hydrolase protein [Microdochium trichocladiopsis]|uniref:Alpha/Beta hydrolase protein n=1 Tax=Microdochium trichocladiopsis TaxID=1682393 RepID=A0A9P8YGB5_9PEZI|nr:Alpha/Beta hydrolase protein [Microdochium trichocladiopsis]KAH7038357.1 Alpha/Beta hydrolase protein [Microdochium trichocladiopsis]